MVQAEVGLHLHERGRQQPLILDVELAIAAADFKDIKDTLDYECIGERASAIAEGGHIELVETFACRLAIALMLEPRVISARVRIEKPEALAPAMAGVEIVLERV